jgi:transcriptional regulator with XRE-family HTH domain
MNLATAIKELRTQHGDSQQAFAARMGLSIRAIANYEKDRVPTLSVLARLAQVARQADRQDLEGVFAESIANQIGLQDNFLWSADKKRGAHGAFMLADVGRSGRSGRAFLMLNVKDTDSAAFVRAFWLAMESYLYPTSDPHDMSYEQAERLLVDFVQNVVRVQETLAPIERARKKK